MDELFDQASAEIDEIDEALGIDSAELDKLSRSHPARATPYSSQRTKGQAERRRYVAVSRLV